MRRQALPLLLLEGARRDERLRHGRNQQERPYYPLHHSFLCVCTGVLQGIIVSGCIYCRYPPFHTTRVSAAASHRRRSIIIPASSRIRVRVRVCGRCDPATVPSGGRSNRPRPRCINRLDPSNVDRPTPGGRYTQGHTQQQAARMCVSKPADSSPRVALALFSLGSKQAASGRVSAVGYRGDRGFAHPIHASHTHNTLLWDSVACRSIGLTPARHIASTHRIVVSAAAG